MVVRDLFNLSDEIRVIARTIFEDEVQKEELDDWIIKYYAQLVKLKNSKIRKSDMMFYLSVGYDSGRYRGDVSGFYYNDVKRGIKKLYSLILKNCRQYASLYVPDYTIQKYGYEVVASEALREYGWNDYDEKIVCPSNVREQIIREIANMEYGLFPTDDIYYERCKRQFKAFYEGKNVPQWIE